MFVDVYAIQNVPPSNINRDDTGSPKTAMYGGVMRSRVSSQAWKRAIRTMFGELLPNGSLGVRTKMVVGLIADRILEIAPELQDDALAMAQAIVESLGIKIDKSKRSGEDEGAPAAGYLIYIANSELDELARIAVEHKKAGEDFKKLGKDLKKEVSAAFHNAQAVDIALFGRMLADAHDLNTDASCQVAHAISVDKISQEYDYFTAVDDCASDDNAGAGMIGDVGFNSSTLYRYATINLDAFGEQLEDADAAAKGVAAFVEAFVKSMPTGKQNTFANRTLPSSVIVAFRREQPFNAVSAFEVPVLPGEKAISSQASDRLVSKIREFEQAYDLPADAAWTVAVEGCVDQPYGKQVSLQVLLGEVHDEALSALSGEE